MNLATLFEQRSTLANGSMKVAMSAPTSTSLTVPEVIGFFRRTSSERRQVHCRQHSMLLRTSQTH
ncbi:hypothetical protein A9K61_04285 [Stenotrophomonas maltophilia]|nr:hypothetical protein A9K61_04285 [Stenotrophomonas maltophilia]